MDCSVEMESRQSTRDRHPSYPRPYRCPPLYLRSIKGSLHTIIVMPRQSQRENLPLELLEEIVTLAYRHRREKHGTADWLKQLATLSKQWGAVCQKLLFSALSFGRQGSLSHRAERPRMTFLAAQPRLAAYVTELRLYSLDTEVYPGAPEMVRTMAVTFPKVRVLVLQKNLVREHPQIVDHALIVFTSIRELVVTTFPLMSMIVSSISYSFARMSLSHLSVSSSCAVAVGLMGALAATDSRHSLRCIELRWLMWDGPNVILSQRTFERFDGLCDLRVHISADCYRLRRIIDVDHGTSAHLVVVPSTAVTHAPAQTSPSSSSLTYTTFSSACRASHRTL
jgi:hypothetical protein